MGIPGRSFMLATVTSNTKVDEAALIQKLKAETFRGRVRLTDFFEDYDPLRSGKISEAKFRTALEAAKICPLSEKELQMLTSRYTEGPNTGRVCYTALLEELNSVFTTPGMERDPNSSVPDITPALGWGATQPLHQMAPGRAEAVEAVLVKLRHVVKTRGVAVRPPFADYERNVNSPLLIDQVTFEQFNNGLAQLDFKLTAAEVDLLQEAFLGAAPGYVNFVAFACAIDPSGESVFSTREPRSTIDQKLHSGFRSTHVLDMGTAQPGRPPTSADTPSLPPSIPSENLAALITKLQNKALERRVRLGEFFQDFDKHNDGTITQPQFIKALSVAYARMHLSLSESEVAMLVDAYQRQMAHGAYHIMWRKFVADIEVVFQSAHMERRPASLPQPRYLQQDPVTLEPEAEGKVQALLGGLRKRVELRRVLVKPLFADFEKSVGSPKVIDHCTRAQMVQSFSRFGIQLTPEEQALLFLRYDTLGDGTVNFVALVRDLDPYESFSMRTTTHHAFPQDPQFASIGRGVPPGGFWTGRTIDGPVLNVQPGRPPTVSNKPGSPPPSSSLAVLLARLSGAMSRHRIRVEECFSDFDRHRDGTVTVPQFNIGMQAAFGKYEALAEADFQLLATSFGIQKPGAMHVQWKSFCQAVAESAPAAASTTVRSPPLPLNAEEEASLAAVLSRFAMLCKTRRILPRPFFADMQNGRRSMNRVDHITRGQFWQCLSSLGLECSAHEMELMNRKFDDMGDGMFNFVAFTRAVDPAEAHLGRDLTETGRGFVHTPFVSSFKASGGFKSGKVVPAQPGRPPLASEYPRLLANAPSVMQFEALLKRIQIKVSKFHIALDDFFRDHDRHKNGTITRAQFRAGIDRALSNSYVRADLTGDEMSLLEDHYAVMLTDGSEGVAYRRFAADVDTVLCLPHLEYAPTVQPEEVQASMIAPGRVVDLGPADEAKLAKLLAAIAERFRINKVPTKGPFADFAKSQNSPMMIDRVTRQQFQQALETLGPQPSAEDMSLLFRKYDDKGEGSVNYVAFCHAVDAIETHSARLSTPSYENVYAGFRKPNAAYAVP